MIVVVIIGIIIAFILSAAMDGVRRSEERATQALISKIEAGLTDRMDALNATRGDVNLAHVYVASMWYQSQPLARVASPQRAQVIAQFDRVKAELPDVFIINSISPNYLFNFQAQPYGPPNFAAAQGISYSSGLTSPDALYLLPLGVGVSNNPNQSFGDYSGTAIPESTGIYGASYAVIGSLMKQLGATSAGFDGADNNGDGLIDELAEGGLKKDLTDPNNPITKFVNAHTHKTARAEVLYAVLVDGLGPLGSVFSADDFSDREVKDTDNDGLLEFVDAWGEPLQFFRWPVFYYGQDSSKPDVQRGSVPGNSPYISVSEQREVDPLDPNNLLLSPAWWAGPNSDGASFNVAGPFGAGQGPLSSGAMQFQKFFHILVEPNSGTKPSLPNPGLWDRGMDYSQRRAYYSRPLILSAGPDKIAGVARIDLQYFNDLGVSPSQKVPFDATSLAYESQAAAFTPSRTDAVYQRPDPNDQAVTNAIMQAGADDITNHNLSSPGGAIQ